MHLVMTVVEVIIVDFKDYGDDLFDSHDGQRFQKEISGF